MCSPATTQVLTFACRIRHTDSASGTGFLLDRVDICAKPRRNSQQGESYARRLRVKHQPPVTVADGAHPVLPLEFY